MRVPTHTHRNLQFVFVPTPTIRTHTYTHTHPHTCACLYRTLNYANPESDFSAGRLRASRIASNRRGRRRRRRRLFQFVSYYVGRLNVVHIDIASNEANNVPHIVRRWCSSCCSQTAKQLRLPCCHVDSSKPAGIRRQPNPDHPLPHLVMRSSRISAVRTLTTAAAMWR